MSFMPNPGTRVRMKDGREATVAFPGPDAATEDMLTFDDGHTEPTNAWQIAEILSDVQGRTGEDMEY
jgi:hypothetical protein